MSARIVDTVSPSGPQTDSFLIEDLRNRTLRSGEIEMSYKAPRLIKEPKLRWPIVLLAALMTGLIALLVGVMHHVAWTS
jgi:hypothetical protein